MANLESHCKTIVRDINVAKSLVEWPFLTA